MSVCHHDGADGETLMTTANDRPFGAQLDSAEVEFIDETAEARECVYGSVGGPKRPRSKFLLSRS